MRISGAEFHVRPVGSDGTCLSILESRYERTVVPTIRSPFGACRGAEMGGFTDAFVESVTYYPEYEHGSRPTAPAVDGIVRDRPPALEYR